MTSLTPLDGQITSLPVLPTSLNGAEVQEIVAPGDPNQGSSYKVTTAILAAFFSAYASLNRTVLTADATVGSPYMALTSDTEIFVFKTVGAPSGIVLPNAASMIYALPVLIKDWKGDASTNNITITFSGGQTCDNQASIVIANDFGWIWAVPGPGASGETGWGLCG